MDIIKIHLTNATRLFDLREGKPPPRSFSLKDQKVITFNVQNSLIFSRSLYIY